MRPSRGPGLRGGVRAQPGHGQPGERRAPAGAPPVHLRPGGRHPPHRGRGHHTLGLAKGHQAAFVLALSSEVYGVAGALEDDPARQEARQGAAVGPRPAGHEVACTGRCRDHHLPAPREIQRRLAPPSGPRSWPALEGLRVSVRRRARRGGGEQRERSRAPCSSSARGSTRPEGETVMVLSSWTPPVEQRWARCSRMNLPAGVIASGHGRTPKPWRTVTRGAASRARWGARRAR